jgi:hypothetical protein
MRQFELFRGSLVAGAISCAAFVLNVAACGGSDSTPIIAGDSGLDGGSSSSSSGGTSSGSGGGSGSGSGATLDSGQDSTIGDSSMNGDSTMGDGTGGDSTSTQDAADAGAGDATMVTDAADGEATDSGAGDGPDGSASCGADNTACLNNGSQGLCKTMVCAACTDTTDDANCKTAYGSASKSYLCLAGVCTPGDCRINTDCAANPNGGLCGVSTPNLCGKCTSDQQCAGNSSGLVCNTGTGQCVAGTCAIDAGITLGGAPAPCAVNGSDICCTGTCQPGAGVNACCPGVNAAAYCAAKISNAQATCVNHVCTACPQVSGANPNYLVDPNGGSDTTGTGDSTTAGCAFKTIARALQVIPASPIVATTITVLGPSTVRTGETFPVTLPQNVTVTTTGGAVVVSVPTGSSGFTLNAVGSAINGGTATFADGGTGPGLTINGQNGGANDATFGIVVDTAAGATTGNAPQVTNVVVTSFLDDGILVEHAGIARIGAAVTSTLNGTVAARKAGLHVTGTGQAIIGVAYGLVPTHFDANTNHGILVDTGGSITIVGSVTAAAAGVGTVTTNRNFAAGVWIQQTPGTPPINSISGLVSFGNTNGNGLRLLGGSNVKLRGSASLGNQASGVLVSAPPVANGNDISKIDLGTPADAGGTAGGNTLQEPLGSGNNGSAGICLEVRPNAGTLQAAGNIFGTVNCATNGPMLARNIGACGNAACTGGVCDLGITTAIGNGFDVSMCTP